MRNVPAGAIMALIAAVAAAAVRDAAASEPPRADDDDAAPSPAAARPTGTVRGVVTIDPPDSLVPPNLARAVVYIDSDPDLEEPFGDAAAGAAPPPIDERPEIAQRNKSFVPDFLVVKLGTYVEFPNWDDFSHNVFSRSAAAPPFDLDRYGRGESKSYQFVKTGVVQVFCNIHPKMRATVVVTPNRYFAVADVEGRFAIPDVPAGTYDMVAWHPRCPETRQAVEVVPGEAAPLSITLRQDVNRILAQRRGPESSGVTRGLGVKREQLNLPVVEEAHPACCSPADDETIADATDEHAEPPH